MIKNKVKITIVFLFNLVFLQLNSQEQTKYSRLDFSLNIFNNINEGRDIKSVDNEAISVTQNKLIDYSGRINYYFYQKKRTKIGFGISYNQYSKSVNVLVKNSPYNFSNRLPKAYYNFIIENNIKIQTFGINFILEKSFFNSFFLNLSLNVEIPTKRTFSNIHGQFEVNNTFVRETIPKNSFSFYNYIIPEIVLNKYISPNFSIFGGIKFSFWDFTNQYEISILKNQNEILDFKIDSKMSYFELGIKYSFF